MTSSPSATTDSWPTLYLNRNVEAARAQITRLLRGTPLTADDLADDVFDLVSAVLPQAQVIDCVSDEGLAAAGLPSTYPVDESGHVTDPGVCQRTATSARESHWEGVESRSAADPDASRGASELAWWGHGARAAGRRPDALRGVECRGGSSPCSKSPESTPAASVLSSR